MIRKANEVESKSDLRLRALSRLTGRSAPDGARASASVSLRVLHELASSPSTAADALALLHELQVHQVELDMQDEELLNARAELEAALVRQVQLYDRAPVGSFTIDQGTVVHELNLTGADLLGDGRDALVGRTLDEFLAPDSRHALHAMLTRVSGGSLRAACELQLTVPDAVPRVVHASVSADPAGRRFLVAFMEIGEPKNEA